MVGLNTKCILDVNRGLHLLERIYAIKLLQKHGILNFNTAIHDYF